MSISNVFGMLQQYASGAVSPQQDPEKDFDHVAQNASQQHLATGLAGAFRSDATPPFAQMISGLFANSNGQQRAGILGQLLGAAGRDNTSVTPEQAQQVSPNEVHDLAKQAENQTPSIVDQASNFYAQHPTLVKGLGAAALAMVMSHMSQNKG